MRRNSKITKNPISLEEAFKVTNATTICTRNGFLIDGTLKIKNKRVVIMEEHKDKNTAENAFLLKVKQAMQATTYKHKRCL